MADYHVVGKSFRRADSVDRVSGKAIYGIDFKLPRMLWGQVLRSPYPHARIVSLDVAKAARFPGVKAVLTAKDLPSGKHGVALKDQEILPREKVRFIGEVVALVAAWDEDTAREALALIEVEYQELPAVFDPEEAMKENAPRLHEELDAYQRIPHLVRPLKGTNVCNYLKVRKGDLKEGFEKSDLIVEDSFATQMVQHCYLEPHAAVAVVQAGKVTVWANSQAAYRLRSYLTDAFNLPLSQVRVIGTKVGGGFGGKLSAEIEPFCVALAERTSQPVKMVMSREEEFIASSVRHPATVKVKTGAKKDGTLLAREVTILWDTGAYSKHGPLVAWHAGYSAGGPYQVTHQKIDSYCIYTNKVPAGAFRGFGLSQTAWAVESQMDSIASQLRLDPLEIRLRNIYQEGSISATGEVLRSVGARECLTQAAARMPGKVRGLACIHKFTAPFTASCAYVKLNEDGTVGVLTSAMDIGQGSDTVLAQMAAEELGLLPSQVTISNPDTDATPYDYGTLSSRVTFHTGQAVRMAAADAREQIIRLAAERLEARPEDLILAGGKVQVKGSPERGISLAELAGLSHTFKAGPILGRGSFLSEDVTPLDGETGQGAKPTEYWKYAAQAAQVGLDEETGEIHHLALASAVDAGFAINPDNVKGQIQGATLMGVGTTLLEEMVLKQGKVINPSFMDYQLPTALDAPPLEAIVVEVPHPDGPFGAKGVGESATPPAAPAIANAIFQVAGIRIKELPLTSEKIYWAVKAKRG